LNRRLFDARLSEEAAAEHGIARERLKAAARALVAIIREGLVRDGVVRVHGFGTFRLRPTHARRGINPRTGERITIPARHRVLFRPAKALRERIEPDRPAAVPLGEPHPSREATLGTTSLHGVSALGTVPAVAIHHPPRAAEAGVATAEPAPEDAAATGSREAVLGGAAADAHPAGSLPTGDVPEESPFEREPAVPTVAAAPPVRGSREATLGADGLRPVSASGTVPAVPSDWRRASAYADAEAERPAPDEPAPSREAALGGAAIDAHPAGTLAPEEAPEEEALEREPPPPPPPEHPADAVEPGRGSREATLGADGLRAIAASGTIPAVSSDWQREPAYGGTEVATDATDEPRGSREATLGGTAAGGRPAGNVPPAASAGGDDSRVAPAAMADPTLRVYDRRGTSAADDLLPDMRHDSNWTGYVGAQGAAGNEPKSAAEGGATGRRRGVWLLLLLLAILLVLLLWWAWPGSLSDTAHRTDVDRAGAAPADDTSAAASADDESASTTRGMAVEPAGDEDEVDGAADEAAAAGTTTESGAATDAGAAPDEATSGGSDSDTSASRGAKAATSGPDEQTMSVPADTGGSAGAGEGADEQPAAASIAQDTETPAQADTAGSAQKAATSGRTQASTDDAGDAGRVAPSPSGEKPTRAAAEAGSQETAHDTAAEPLTTASLPAPAAGAQPDDQAATATSAGAAAQGRPYFAGREYEVQRGDTLWGLAERNYENPFYWPHIWNKNGDIPNPDRLDVHQILWLPTLEGDPRNLTESDRRSIAEGYLRLYYFFREQGDANPRYALIGVRYFDPAVMPDKLRGSAAGRPTDTLAAAFEAQLQAEFPLDD